MSTRRDEPSGREDHGGRQDEREELPVLPEESPFDFDRKWDRGIVGELHGDVRKGQKPPVHLDE